MKRLVPIMAALLLAGCDVSQPIRHTPMTPNIRLAAVPGRPAAGYFELRIEGDRGALVSVTSPQAGRIEMHETMSSGSMSSMRPLQRIAVRDGDNLVFAPGGRHLMIYDVDPAVRPGGELSFTLNFERGPPRTLSATVRAAGEGD
jgi:periplasmic copper chaperone A